MLNHLFKKRTSSSVTNDKDSTCNDSQQQPFQVVLIDIQKAAKGEIYCIKKPLTEELKYVAISYRWGELHEAFIDTRVGYVASITSFNLYDFYKLCKAMTKETDLKSIHYVWVDAICVNQSNSFERKATIYHMSDIYNHATWILAVPDLHAEHLKAMTNHGQAIKYIQSQRLYIYYLLHENTKELDIMDINFLNDIGVPQVPDLRQLLIKHTNFFADCFTIKSDSIFRYKDTDVLEHLFEIHHHPVPDDSRKYERKPCLQQDIKKDLPIDKLRSLHQCKDREDCPFEFSNYYQSRINSRWYIDITERGKRIRQAMHFLKDLVVDWSSRVWVISEFHIAKKKNNLKLWFLQLDVDKTALTFFKFDMNDPRFKRIQENRNKYTDIDLADYPVYFFNKTLIDQLNNQSFLEMILKSKASKNEDRFYSVFPLFSQYKDLIQREDLVEDVSSILSVKLKLYQFMTMEHKKLLFFLSAMGDATYILPTFATSSMYWNSIDMYNLFAREFNDAFIGIALVYIKSMLHGNQHYLKVTPKEWEAAQVKVCDDTPIGRTLFQLLHPKFTARHWEADASWELDVDLVNLMLPIPLELKLAGSFKENKWIFAKTDDFIMESSFKWKNDAPDDFSAFHVY